MEVLTDPRFLIFCFFNFSLTFMFASCIFKLSLNLWLKLLWSWLWIFCMVNVWTFIR